MQNLLQIVVLLFCICLCGCETTDSTIKSEASANSDVAYVHSYSKFSFPKQIKQFQFAGVIQYDRDGRDVSVGYNSPTPVMATVYVYPAAKNFTLVPSSPLQNVSKSLVDFEFKRREQEIFHAHPDAKLVTEEPFQITQGNNYFLGMRAVFLMNFRFGLFSKNSLSELYIFLIEPNVMFLVNDRQFVEYRITYPTASKVEAEKEISSFLSELKWSTK
jgi:hypothetical protein